MRYLIDTNALIYAIKKKQDLAGRIDGQILIPNLVVKELKILSKYATKATDRAAAKLARQLIKHHKWKIVKLEKGHTDEKMREYAKEHGYGIYTFDRKLKAQQKP